MLSLVPGRRDNPNGCRHTVAGSGEAILHSHQFTAECANQVEFLPKGKNSGDHISGMGKCSSSQLSKLKRSIADAAPFIKKAVDNRDNAAWTKWFGAATSQQTDADVQTRLNDGYKQVTSNDWEPRCCAASGSTDQECANNCKGQTQAFVQSYKYQGSDKEYQYNQIQFCASVFSTTDVQLGLIAFHESVHMVSAAGDGYGAYGKKSLIKLAKTEPDKARLTANSYMLYAAQAGMNHAQYDSATALWGGSMNADGTCGNKYGNCGSLASASSCASGTLSSGETIQGACCEACSAGHQNAGSSTSAPAQSCSDTGSTCADWAKRYNCNGNYGAPVSGLLKDYCKKSCNNC
jgi:hypothetical protein